MTGSLAYRGLLTVFVLAAGCADEFDAFAEERARLDCEITAVCNDAEASCEAVDVAPKGDCIRFRPRHADQCLADMEDWLARVEQDTEQCTVFESRACDEVTEWVNTRRGCDSIDGRPLRERGTPVLAAITRGEQWADEALAAAVHRRAPAAGKRWLQSARYEHASVAAFGAVATQLLALGAPPALIEGCHRAALDEIEHARAALSIARALLDERVDFGPLRPPAATATTLRGVAIDALREGCIGEGIAAARARVGAARACPAVAAALGTIAEDETRHASLAWATLRWALQRDRGLAPVLRAELRAAQEIEPDRDQAAHPAWGLLSGAEEAEIARTITGQIVAPVLEALIRSTEHGTTWA